MPPDFIAEPSEISKEIDEPSSKKSKKKRKSRLISTDTESEKILEERK